jgi:hypothetical protein
MAGDEKYHDPWCKSLKCKLKAHGKSQISNLKFEISDFCLCASDHTPGFNIIFQYSERAQLPVFHKMMHVEVPCFSSDQAREKHGVFV